MCWPLCLEQDKRGSTWCGKPQLKAWLFTQQYRLDTLESSSSQPLFLTSTPLLKVFKNISLFTNPFASAPVQSLIDCLLGFINSSPSPKPLCPLNSSSPLALTYFSMDSPWSVFNYFVILLPTLDFPVKHGSQCPNKNSLAQSSPPQEHPGTQGEAGWYCGMVETRHTRGLQSS